MKNLRYIIALFSATLIVFSACKKNEEDEQENLNTVKITLTEGGATTTFTWTDTDGIGGGNAPKIDTIKLSPNKTYTLAVDVLDASVTPAKSYLEEIKTENNAHLFVYKPTGNVTIDGLSTDANGKAFGHTANLKTTAAGNGTLQMQLKHLPNKSAADPSTTGETDIDITFPVVIK